MCTHESQKSVQEGQKEASEELPLLRITVLLSGEGTNFQALVDALPYHSKPSTPSQTQSSKLQNVAITHVISSKPNVNGLNRAARYNIPTTVHSPASYKPPGSKKAPPEARAKFDTDLAKIVLSSPHDPNPPDLVFCLGYMLILTPNFLGPLDKANVPILNLHPALPGAFDGVNAIHRAWEAGQRGEIDKAGVMIHRVIEEVDKGEPVLVKKIDIIKDESEAEFEKRMHAAEWEVVVKGTEIEVARLREG